MRMPLEWAEYVFDDSIVPVWRDLIRSLLGWTCKQCYGRGDIDIHHINHDGGAWREVYGGYTSVYYLDILWGVLHDCDEVILLCRKCHKKHHKLYGYDELD